MSAIVTPSKSRAEEFRDDEAYARELDVSDPLRSFRERFHIPGRDDGEPVIYYTGNSLGLQPRGVQEMLAQELEDWKRLAVDGHFKDTRPWYSYHEQFREPMARVVGAKPSEVVLMNSLTVNLHLMMVTFFKPTQARFKILMEGPAFPSDTYAIESHLKTRGLDPKDALLVLSPREGEHTIRAADLESTIEQQGESIALVLLSGVNYYTGQFFDLPRITSLAKSKECVVGFDLAHAAGNVPMALHDWDVDFACWCTYKYLNGGPGSIAGCFIHEQHAGNTDLPRYAGWWGNDPESRFRMHLNDTFIAKPDADGWQISNPPIFSMTPLVASLAIFDEATMPALREKSVRMTAYLRWLIERQPSSKFECITPQDPEFRGSQLSILVHDEPQARHVALQASGIVADFRPPNVIRVAPVPLYNTYHEAWRFAKTLCQEMS
ncbi:MAG: kynureninase [Planctomycetota bacterium]|nr:kynureninase [Planctomycetota bacterium]